MHNSESKAKQQLSEDRKSRYLRNHQSMEARYDSSLVKGRQTHCHGEQWRCEPSQWLWLLYKEENAAVEHPSKRAMLWPWIKQTSSKF